MDMYLVNDGKPKPGDLGRRHFYFGVSPKQRENLEPEVFRALVAKCTWYFN